MSKCPKCSTAIPDEEIARVTAGGQPFRDFADCACGVQLVRDHESAPWQLYGADVHRQHHFAVK